MKFKLALSCFLSFCLINSTVLATPQEESDAARIKMLEQALTPKSATDLASLFAEANKNRNGAVQFMLFSDSLKDKYKEMWPYWVSGTSSPWITSYSIKTVQHKNNCWKFKITYQWATSSGPFDPPLIQFITVKEAPNTEGMTTKQWIITQFDTKE